MKIYIVTEGGYYEKSFLSRKDAEEYVKEESRHYGQLLDFEVIEEELSIDAPMIKARDFGNEIKCVKFK